MDWDVRKNWDEFEWEKEIRKDELRISCYFHTLPCCLDLPGEDDMIFKRLMSKPELVPTGASKDSKHLPMLDFGEPPEDDEEDEDGEPRKRGMFVGQRRLERQATEWNLLAASKVPDSGFDDALAVTCAFGKLISRTVNFSEIEESDETKGLRISLVKRMLSDLNELSQAMEKLQAKKLLPDSYLARYFEQFTYYRESMLDLLNHLREK